MPDTFVFPRDLIEVDSILATNVLADTIYKEIRSRGGLFCAELHLTGFSRLPASAKITRFYSDNQNFESFLNGIAVAYDDGFLMDTYQPLSEVMRGLMLSITGSSIGRVIMSLVTPHGLIEMKATYRGDIFTTLTPGGKSSATRVVIKAEDAHKWFKDHGYEC